MKMVSVFQNLGDVVRYMRGIRSGFRAFKGPHNMTIKITDRCNFNCLECDKPKNNYEMPVAIFEKLVVEAKKMKTRFVTINADGEPFMHPAIMEMFEILKDNGIRCAVITNGSLVEDRTVSMLQQSGVDHLRLSLWTVDKENYRFLHNASSDHLDSVEAWLLYRKRKRLRRPLIKAVFLLSKLTLKDLDQIFIFCSQTGVDLAIFDLLKIDHHRYPSVGFAGKEDLSRMIECLREKLTLAHRLKIKTNIRSLLRELSAAELNADGYYTTPFMPCYVGWLHMHISTEGDVSPCCNVKKSNMGNMHRESLYDIFNGKKYGDFRYETQMVRRNGCRHRTCRDDEMCPYFEYNQIFDRLNRLTDILPKRGRHVS